MENKQGSMAENVWYKLLYDKGSFTSIFLIKKPPG